MGSSGNDNDYVCRGEYDLQSLGTWDEDMSMRLLAKDSVDWEDGEETIPFRKACRLVLLGQDVLLMDTSSSVLHNLCARASL